MGLRHTCCGIGLDVEYIQPVNFLSGIDNVRYVVKFVCGELEELGPEGVPAIYRTAINLLNFNSEEVFVGINATLTSPASTGFLGSTGFLLDSLEGQEIDCNDIRNLLGAEFENAPFVSGFLTIDVTTAPPLGTLPRELQVAAVYTTLHQSE